MDQKSKDRFEAVRIAMSNASTNVNEALDKHTLDGWKDEKRFRELQTHLLKANRLLVVAFEAMNREINERSTLPPAS